MTYRQILRSLQLFRKGCSIAKVAKIMEISYKEALKLNRIYFQEEEMAERIMRSDSEITEYYRVKLEKQQKEAEMPQDVWNRVGLIREFLPESLEIFFLIHGARRPLVWASNEEIYKDELTFRSLRRVSKFN